MKRLSDLPSLLLIAFLLAGHFLAGNAMAAQPLAEKQNEQQTEQQSEKRKPNAARLINFQISSPHRSETYSCDLIAYSKQCREYEILATAKATLDELTDGCGSMGGQFKKTECPSKGYIASCVDIVRNYHRPDVIYNNLYYEGKPTAWTMKDVERVCSDLGGELEE